MRQLWATITRSSILVPSPIKVGPLSAPVDRRAGAHFGRRLQHDVAQLGREDVRPPAKTVAESVGPQHGIGMDQAPGPNRILVEHGVGEDVTSSPIREPDMTCAPE